MWTHFLAGELRPHVLWSAANKKIKPCCVLPLGYCMQFWSPHLKKEIIELEKAQIRVFILAQGKEGLPIETDPNKKPFS